MLQLDVAEGPSLLGNSEVPREGGVEVMPLKAPGVELFPSLHLGQETHQLLPFLAPQLGEHILGPCLCKEGLAWLREGGGRLWPFIPWAETPLRSLESWGGGVRAPILPPSQLGEMKILER